MVNYEGQRLKNARQSFGNAEHSREMHNQTLENFNLDIRKNSALRNRSFALSAFAGLVFSAGVLGTTTRLLQAGDGGIFRGVITRLLIAQAIAGGISIAYTSGLTLVFERIVYNIELKRELWEIENYLDGEIQEMVAIYRAQGLSKDEAMIVTNIFARRKASFANLMMVEELGYSRLEPPSPLEALVDAAVPAAIGYAAGSLPPFLPLVARRLSAAQVEVAGLCVLAVGTVTVSVALLDVFYGGYANRTREAKVALLNLFAVGVIFGAARMTSCLFCCV